jgi:acetyl esterase/lipase
VKLFYLALLSALLTAGCRPPNSSGSGASPQAVSAAETGFLADARRGFKTQLVRREQSGDEVPRPPSAIFRVVQFDSPAGKLAAYLSPDPGDGQKHPAIIWITGGDCNTIGDVWSEATPDNDQTAAAYRRAGIAMMFPSLRGGNQNPGYREGFYGEVDDVLAAADYLATQPFVDPGRIYLGGHSTGGTLVLLVAASSDRFRAVFSFGPADDVAGYGADSLPFDLSNPREFELRAPGRWLHSIQSPTFVFEGAQEPCNLGSLQSMSSASKNSLVQFHQVHSANHFSILARTNSLIAGKILDDNGPTTKLAFTAEELR